MPSDDATRERIASLIERHPVVLFMKGDRQQPQCGFSARVIQILDSLLPDYAICDVLADPDVRNGIKAYSNWPTIPQLYVRGEFIGGCDIVTEMFASGELHQKLGVERAAAEAPQVTVTPAAAAALRELAAQRPGQALHLSVDAGWHHGLWFGPEQAGDARVESNGISVHVDALSASRAQGVVIDAVDTPQGPGFRIENPGAPAAVRQLTAKELKAKLDAGERFVFLDARTPEERATASIPGTRLLDEATARQVESLARDTEIVIHCHHGGRSQAAAEHFAALGFSRVSNLVGGIDAWSRDVDSSVPRY